MPSRQDRPIFTYQTRVSVTPQQDQLLREYARRFGHIEQTLFADLEKGKDANQLKSEYLRRYDITARQFNALRIQLQGKIASIQELIPVHMANLKTKIRRARKTIAALVPSIPGSNKLHQKRRRLARLEQGLKELAADRKAGRVRICFGSRSCSMPSFISRRTVTNRMQNGIRIGPRPGLDNSLSLVRRTRAAAARAASPWRRGPTATAYVCGCPRAWGKSMCSLAGFAFAMEESSSKNLWPTVEPCRIAFCTTRKAGGYSSPQRERGSSGSRISNWGRSASTSIRTSWCWRK